MVARFARPNPIAAYNAANKLVLVRHVVQAADPSSVSSESSALVIVAGR